MARRVTVVLEDDLDGGPAEETVRFAFGAADYEIDLSARNARAFRSQLRPFVEHARRVGPGRPGRPARTAASRRRSGDVRAWAKDHGIAVSERGRIPASVVAQYERAARRRLRDPARRRRADPSLARQPGRGHGPCLPVTNRGLISADRKGRHAAVRGHSAPVAAAPAPHQGIGY